MPNQSPAHRQIQAKSESLEPGLEIKLNELSFINETTEGFKYSVTKNGHEYSGLLLVESSQGKIFATAVASGISEVTAALLKQIRAQ